MDKLNLPPVVDPKLSAPRGAAYSAGALLDEELLDDTVPVHYYPEGQQAEAASTATAIDASNKGFQLLQKMGWKGKGLGKNQDGIAEPIKAGVEAGVRLGLGKQQEDDKYTAAENIQRKKLEVELQIDEDPERTKRREAEAEREAQIKQNVTEILKTFYCQVCNKQYTTAMELEEHLSSYDHHHKKRLAEARAAELERTRDERQRKEQRRQQREQQRLEEQIRKAQAAAARHQGNQQPPPRLPTQPPPAPAAAAGSSTGCAGAPPPPPPPGGQTAAGNSGWGPDQPATARGASGGWSNAPPPPAATSPPPPPPAELPPEQKDAIIAGTGMSFGLKTAAGAGRGGGRLPGGRVAGGRVAGGRTAGPAGLAGVKRPAAAIAVPAAATGGLGYKSGPGGTGTGLGFKGGFGSKKPGSVKVSAAFGDSSSDEGGA